MKRVILAANWKMHLGPAGARQFLGEFLARHHPAEGREVWLFPAAVALETVAAAVRGLPRIRVGAQNVHWEPKGAFTGEISVGMAKEAGASMALVGHSERRHVFGETVPDTRRKVEALLQADLSPLLCVGELLEERDAGETIAVVEAQLAALEALSPDQLNAVPIAYEPVWAIGTGKTATPADAAEVHAAIRTWLAGRGATDVRVLYGGSVKLDNVRALLGEPEIDGVLVGGASLDPTGWAEMAATALD